MRADTPYDEWFAAAAGALAVATGSTLGGLAMGADGALGGGVAGLAAAAGLRMLLTTRGRRLREALRVPFPDAWRDLLESEYDHFARLPSELRARFEDDVRLFLADTRITGIQTEVTDELRLMVAASAVTLTLGWPDFDWEAVTEVLLYPQDFGRDYSFEAKELSGQAHAWGTVILSVPSLRESFRHPEDGYHVGLHEFTHLLDMDRGRFDGVPVGFPPERLEEWQQLVEREMDRLLRGKSAIDPYGGDEPAEFLAVAVEAFFELPQELRRRHAELYEILREYFLQDPAAWDDARG